MKPQSVFPAEWVSPAMNRMEFSMDRELFVLLQEAKRWLASRPAPLVLSAEWQTHNQLRLFIDMLQKDSSLPSLEMAINNLRRYMVAKFDWSADYCTAVSRICSQADQIRRRARHAGTDSLAVGRQSERVLAR